MKDAGLLCCVALDPASLGELVDALAEIDVPALPGALSAVDAGAYTIEPRLAVDLPAWHEDVSRRPLRLDLPARGAESGHQRRPIYTPVLSWGSRRL